MIVRAGRNVDVKVYWLPVSMIVSAHFWFSVSCGVDVRGYTGRAVLGICCERHPVHVVTGANIKSPQQSNNSYPRRLRREMETRAFPPTSYAGLI